jgi:hypothetical protein
MTDLLTAEHRIEAQRLVGDDGYERMANAGEWNPVASWGSHGWDLGKWPLVVVYHAHIEGRWLLAEDVEGDFTAYSYPTEDMRTAATDQLAFFHWKHEDAEWVAGIEDFDALPPELRGPFTR